jgi:amino acid adenylation domain-containing protein
MIIQTFEQIAASNPHRIAVQDRGAALSYDELNRAANRLAHALIGEPNAAPRTVGLMFHQSLEGVAAVLGTLKSGNIYVPLDSRQPVKRLARAIEFFEIGTVVACGADRQLVEELGWQTTTELKFLAMENFFAGPHRPNPSLEIPADAPAYIIQTSGSSGAPKGVVQSRKSIHFFTERYIESLDISQDDRLTFISSFCHDGLVEDLYPALLSGACLCPYNIDRDGAAGVGGWLAQEQLTVYHSVPTVFRYIGRVLKEGGDNAPAAIPNVRVICMGAEPLNRTDLALVNNCFPNARLAHMYGQTESSVNTMGFIDTQDPRKKITLGRPLEGIELWLLDDNGREVDDFETGEIFVVSDYLAAGYWKDEQATAAAFIEDPAVGRLYRSGDLGRMDFDGAIEFMGRKDNQVKIRGFRVEPGEIESHLRTIPGIGDSIVTAESMDGEDTLIAYFTIEDSDPQPGENTIRAYLKTVLPDHFIPSYFIRLDQFPRLPNGKLDKQGLPDPRQAVQEDHHPLPSGQMEQCLVKIWAEVLNIPAKGIGIHDNFFALGGHSLKATILATRIHRETGIMLHLKQIFEAPTVLELAALLQDAQGPNQIPQPQAVEKKDYYHLSPAQKRLYIVDGGGLGYNMPRVIELTGELDRDRLLSAFKRLIQRHESLRTSFHMLEGTPVQRIHETVDFHLEYLGGESPLEDMARDFIRPFDLAKAPLIRAGLVEQSSTRHLLIVDLHHIIADGTSLTIITEEFPRLYNGVQIKELPVQYKDFAALTETVGYRRYEEEQRNFWREMYNPPPQPPEWPTDYPRPDMMDFNGDMASFTLPPDTCRRLKALAKGENATLFMALSAIYALLLRKLTGSDDIVFGVPVRGRTHSLWENVVGMFVNTLALRFQPREELDFREFLADVRDRTLSAFQHQDYPFDALVEQVVESRIPGRHPLFDTMLVLHNMDLPEVEMGGLGVAPYPYENKISKFDLHFEFFESPQGSVNCNVEFRTALFKQESIRTFCDYFLETTNAVANGDNPTIAQLTGLSKQRHRKLEGEFSMDLDSGMNWL